MFASRLRLLVKILLFLNLQCSIKCATDAKATYKSGEIPDPSSPITIDTIKSKLKDTGVFDEQREILNDRERKELKKLFDAVEIMTSSRNRQPQNVQNMFSSLRLVERVVRKQLKEGQISEALAKRFRWEKISTRQKRDKPIYTLDDTTQMRVFAME